MLNPFDTVVDMTQERPPDRIRWYGPILRGWLARDFNNAIIDNPHEPYTADWYSWRDGWFARDRGEDAVIPCKTWDEVPVD